VNASDLDAMRRELSAYFEEMPKDRTRIYTE
jgi:hypothetical protein